MNLDQQRTPHQWCVKTAAALSGTKQNPLWLGSKMRPK